MSSLATAQTGSASNKTGVPQAECGGIAGRVNAASLTRCVSVNNKLKATNEGGGNEYLGSIVGWELNSNPVRLYRVLDSLQYCGSNKAYVGKELSIDSYADLVAMDGTFNNGYWMSDDGKIAIKFNK